MVVLCDGNRFYYYRFENGRQTRSANPQVFLGQFPDGSRQRTIFDSYRSDPVTFIRQVRPICESLFYVFLSGYVSGLDAYWKRSVERGKKQGKKRSSAEEWHKAKDLAAEALGVAKSAWDQRKENEEESRQSAEIAFELLTERFVLCCFILRQWTLTI